MPTPRRPFSGLLSVGAAALALSVGGCSKPEPPTLIPKEAKVTALRSAGVDVLLRVEATNPNRVALSARSVTGKATLDGRWSLGAVAIEKPVVLPPRASTTIDVPMTLPYSDLGVLATLASRAEPVPYVVDGTVAVGGERLNVELPFSISGTITREQIATAALRSLPVTPGLAPARPR